MAKKHSVTSIALFQEKSVRRVWHEDRWFFSIIDVIAVLTLSENPRRYWSDMKRRVRDEGFIGALARCVQMEMIATDGKVRETDCADIETIYLVVQSLPAIHRREHNTPIDSVCTTGIYSILNTITDEQYIGSSIHIPNRFLQHRSDLRRGEHHSAALQSAWDQYGEDAFLFVVREEVPETDNLEATEQRYLDVEKPCYNVASSANNAASLKPLTDTEIQDFMTFLRHNAGVEPHGAVSKDLRIAIDAGIVIPGPKFHELAQAELNGVTSWEALQIYLLTTDNSNKAREDVYA